MPKKAGGRIGAFFSSVDRVAPEIGETRLQGGNQLLVQSGHRVFPAIRPCFCRRAILKEDTTSRAFAAVRAAATSAPVRCSAIGSESWGSKGVAAPPRQPRRSTSRVLYVDAPGWASVDSEPSWWQWARYCRMSGLSMQRCSAAGPYGVRGSDPNRLSGLRGPSAHTGFSDPVLSTVCPYPFLRPAAHTSPTASLLFASLLSPPSQAAERTR